jgi:hypothetical protein
MTVLNDAVPPGHEVLARQIIARAIPEAIRELIVTRAALMGFLIQEVPEEEKGWVILSQRTGAPLGVADSPLRAFEIVVGMVYGQRH